MYDNSLKSDIGFYGLSSVNLYDKGAKVAGLNVVKLSSDDVTLRERSLRVTACPGQRVALVNLSN